MGVHNKILRPNLCDLLYIKQYIKRGKLQLSVFSVSSVATFGKPSLPAPHFPYGFVLLWARPCLAGDAQVVSTCPVSVTSQVAPPKWASLL